MPLINYKVEFKFRWTEYRVFFVLGKENDNANADSNNVVFTLKDTKLYLSVATLSSKINQNFLLNILKSDKENSIS